MEASHRDYDDSHERRKILSVDARLGGRHSRDGKETIMVEEIPMNVVL